MTRTKGLVAIGLLAVGLLIAAILSIGLLDSGSSTTSSAATEQLLPVAANAFDKEFNKIASRAGISDIRSAPTGCMLPTLGAGNVCRYRVGEHSTLSVFTKGQPDSNAIQIDLKSTPRTQA